MQQIKIELELTKTDLENCARRYHFTEENTEQLQRVYASMQLLLECYLEYEKLEALFEEGEENPQKEKGEEKIFCAVTLGPWIDEMQEIYQRAGQVMTAYMAECIAMELLSKAYEKAATFLYEEYGLWVAKYEFYGEERGLKQMAEDIKTYQIKHVRCNGAYQLLPQKSVVFQVILTHEKEERICNICESCGALHCPNRQKET